MNKKLYKSRTDRKIAGVCGGIAEYFDTDASLIRILTVVATLMFLSGIIAYIIAVVIIPDPPEDETAGNTKAYASEKADTKTETESNA